ncbi:MAG: YbaB/EbfC family nucleoid-associated protein [Catenulisporales bacterium]|nr:YbaB/EbfC family nucleoid-associated protein [Catenulisporales bacterium]
MDLQGMLGQAMQMQQRMVEAQHGTAGGGLVSAKVTGTGDLVGLEIKPEAADPEDTETLADLVIAAVRDARAAADRLAADKMGPLAGGGMPDLGNLGNLFG